MRILLNRLVLLFLLTFPAAQTWATCDSSLAKLYGLDQGAKSFVNSTGVPITVDALLAKTPPKALKAERIGPVETTVYQVEATMEYLGYYIPYETSVFKLHGENGSITAYLPWPTCAASSPLLKKIQDAKVALESMKWVAGWTTKKVRLRAPGLWLSGSSGIYLTLGPVIYLEELEAADEDGDGGEDPADDEPEPEPEPEPVPVPSLEIIIPEPVARAAVQIGEEISFDLAFHPVNGFDDGISVSMRSVPDDLSLEVTPSSIEAPGKGVVNAIIGAGPQTFPMMHTVTIEARTTGGQSYSRTFEIDIPCDPPMILGRPFDHPQSRTVSSGERVELRVHASRGTAPLRYQWFEGPRGVVTFPVEGANHNTFLTPPVNQQVSYWVRIYNSCGSVDSWSAMLTPEGSGQPTGRDGRRRSTSRPQP